MPTKPKSAKKTTNIDKLTETSKKGEVELKEDELKKVTGGSTIKYTIKGE